MQFMNGDKCWNGPDRSLKVDTISNAAHHSLFSYFWGFFSLVFPTWGSGVELKFLCYSLMFGFVGWNHRHLLKHVSADPSLQRGGWFSLVICILYNLSFSVIFKTVGQVEMWSKRRGHWCGWAKPMRVRFSVVSLFRNFAFITTNLSIYLHWVTFS